MLEPILGGEQQEIYELVGSYELEEWSARGDLGRPRILSERRARGDLWILSSHEERRLASVVEARRQSRGRRDTSPRGA